MDTLQVALTPHAWKTEPEGKGKGNATALTKDYSTELFLGDRISKDTSAAWQNQV